MSVLSLRELSVEGWGTSLLKGISFDVQAGELTAIIGPNGAGKTTLMNTIIGEHTHSVRGEMMVCGKRVQGGQQKPSTWNSQHRARHMSVLPQFSRLTFPFTVDEVVSLARLPHRTGMTIDRDVVNDALRLLDVLHLKDRLYPKLSGGEKQRVQLARVMAQIWRSEDADQRLLLLDEPTSSLDLGHQQQLMDAVRLFADQGVAVFMIVHDINLALRHADHVLALLSGEAIAQGRPEQVVTRELIHQLYHVDRSILCHPITGKLTVI